MTDRTERAEDFNDPSDFYDFGYVLIAERRSALNEHQTLLPTIPSPGVRRAGSIPQPRSIAALSHFTGGEFQSERVRSWRATLPAMVRFVLIRRRRK
jgi:hypothetical protein